MKVLLFHPRLLPPKDYGGTERVVLWLARGLLERGHEVWVAALPGSHLPEGARLLETPLGESSASFLPRRLPAGIELVHFMAPVGTADERGLPCSSVTTVHGNGKPGEAFSRNTVFLSADHARRHGATEYVHNGIDPAEYRFGEKKETWALFLSKTSWSVKNLRGAMKIASRARVGLRVAGGSRPWSARIACALKPGFEWVGPVSGSAKADLLAGARALVFPVRWPEPFGLVIAEALVSGTPVIGTRRGSLPELVPPEVGLLSESEEELATALASQGRWLPERCRAWAIERFHYSRMAESYERIYLKAARGEPIQARGPVASDWRSE